MAGAALDERVDAETVELSTSFRLAVLSGAPSLSIVDGELGATSNKEICAATAQDVNHTKRVLRTPESAMSYTMTLI